MQFSGLSMDQAPPIDAPFLFFLTVPFFGLLASTLLFFADERQLFALYTQEGVALVHLFTLGILSMVIMGAIQQMLPVLAGVSLPKPRVLARLLYAFMVSGILFFVLSYLLPQSMLFMPGIVLIAFSFVAFFGITLSRLRNVVAMTATIKAMRIAMVSGVIAALLGVVLAVEVVYPGSLDKTLLLGSHILFAFFGFALILVIGVSFQVIPMFYVAAAYKKFCRTYIAYLVFAAVVAGALLPLLGDSTKSVSTTVFLIFLTAFSVATLKKLLQRRRAVSDVTLWFWYAGLVLLIVASVAWFLESQFTVGETFHVAVGFGGSVLFILSGMLYKIVPFLIWFHLNARGYFQIPTMREMIAVRVLKTHFYIALSAWVFMAAAPWYALFLKLSGLLWGMSFFLMGLNFFKALSVYRKTIKRAPDFEL